MPEPRNIGDIPYSGLAAYKRQPEPPLIEAPARPVYNPLVWFLLLGIKAYQLLYPDRFKRRCIYAPTCSEYADISLRKYGIVKGIRRSLRRIRSCNAALFQPGIDLP